MSLKDRILESNEGQVASGTSAVGAVFLLRADGAALLQHRDDKPGLRNSGMWVPPGGHCDPWESIEVCAQREMFEETGYQCDSLNFLIAFEDDFATDGPPYQLSVYWALYDGVQTYRCMEGQALKFVKREWVSEYPMPPYLLELWDMAIEAASLDFANKD